AVHSHRPILGADAVMAVKELFHVAYWLAHTYARGARPAPGLAFDAGLLPSAAPVPRQTLDQLQRLEADLKARDEKLAILLSDKNALEETVVVVFLMPPRPISVPLRFQRDGIRYGCLPAEEKDHWADLEWNEQGDLPDQVDAQAVKTS